MRIWKKKRLLILFLFAFSVFLAAAIPVSAKKDETESTDSGNTESFGEQDHQKFWEDSEKEGALWTLQTTDWSTMSELFASAARGVSQSVRAVNISQQVKNKEKAIYKLLESETYDPDAYTQVLLAVMQVISKGKPDKNKKDPFQCAKYLPEYMIKANGDPPSKTIGGFEESVLAEFYYLKDCLDAHNSQKGWKADIYKGDLEIQSVYQSLILQQGYTKKRQKYTQKSAKKYSMDHKGLYNGESRDSSFADKVMSHLCVSGAGGIDKNGVMMTPYYNQGNGWWQNGHWVHTEWPSAKFAVNGHTLHAAGCGFCTKTMIMAYLTGKPIFPVDYMEDGSYIDNQGMANTGFYTIAHKFGYEVTLITQNVKVNVDKALKSGFPIAQHHTAGFWTSGGHYVALIGLTNDGLYAVNDPGHCDRSYGYNGTLLPWNIVDAECDGYYVFHPPGAFRMS